jgi:deoxyribonuclease V
MWPTTSQDLEDLQRHLAEQSTHVQPWIPQADRPLQVGAVFVATGEPAFAAAIIMLEGHTVEEAVVHATLGAPYAPGLLALRQGPLLEQAVNKLNKGPEVLLVNASGRDHPRRAGLALHLGAVCDLPTIGVTDRPLVATAPEPGPLLLDGEIVGYSVRPRPNLRPLIVHAAWRTNPDTARTIVLSQITTARTPDPLREARRLARTARAAWPASQ